MICIDARLWGINHTGIGRYIENLLDNLPHPSATEYAVIIPPQLDNEPKLKPYKKYHAHHHPYSLKSQIEMYKLLRRIRPDLLHVPHFTIPLFWQGKMVVTIHDLIKHQSRGVSTTTRSPWLYWLKYLGYLFLVKIAVTRASHIIVPACYWKKQLICYYHLSPDKISVTYEASSLINKNLKLKIPNTDPYVIYTGNVYPHKNIPVLLQAIKLLSGRVRLIIVCARNVFAARTQAMVESLGVERWVEFKSGVPDDQLASLLGNSLAFVTPSLIEGFGLPGLEAMTSGAPVIAAQASCLPEIYGDAAVYFDPHNASQLASAIIGFQTDSKLRSDYIKRGYAKAKSYSWKRMAQQTWEIYQKTLP